MNSDGRRQCTEYEAETSVYDFETGSVLCKEMWIVAHLDEEEQILLEVEEKRRTQRATIETGTGILL